MAVKGITVNTAPEAEPHIYAEDDASIFQSIVGDDGVFDTGQKFAATILSNNKVRIADGVGCIGGHFYRIPYGEYFDAEIVNGQSGYHRNDIIVGKFVTTGTGGIDTISVEVVQGAAAATATDPALTQDDLYSAGKIREVPLYRVKIEGLSIVAVEQMFEIIPTIPGVLKRLKSAEAEISQLNGKFIDFEEGSLDTTYGHAEAKYLVVGKLIVLHVEYTPNTNINNSSNAVFSMWGRTPITNVKSLVSVKTGAAEDDVNNTRLAHVLADSYGSIVLTGAYTSGITYAADFAYFMN